LLNEGFASTVAGSERLGVLGRRRKSCDQRKRRRVDRVERPLWDAVRRGGGLGVGFTDSASEPSLSSQKRLPPAGLPWCLWEIAAGRIMKLSKESCRDSVGEAGEEVIVRLVRRNDVEGGQPSSTDFLYTFFTLQPFPRQCCTSGLPLASVPDVTGGEVPRKKKAGDEEGGPSSSQ